MRTPKGCLNVLTRTLWRHAHFGDAKGLNAYVCSEGFRTAFNGMDPGARHSAMRSYVKACDACVHHAHVRGIRPLREPRPLSLGPARRVNWRTPAMQAKLETATSDEALARATGVTLLAARLARQRYWGAAATAKVGVAAWEAAGRAPLVGDPVPPPHSGLPT